MPRLAILVAASLVVGVALGAEIDAGESAIIEIDRDGVRMQLSIPRGPIGMNGNGAVVRTMNWWGG